MHCPVFALSLTLVLTLNSAPGPSAAPSDETKREAKPLAIGDPAPPLAVGRWIKGEPVTALGNGSVTVLDFWATWCGPCRQSIPHMSAIQKQYAGQQVNVIGISIWERTPSAVTPFVQERDRNETAGDEMDYRVATDAVPPLPPGVEEGSPKAAAHAATGAMARTWMEAAELQGIPSVFIVDREGVIAWIGHPADPMNPMDEALAQIAAGTWDLAQARASAERAVRAEAIVLEIQTKLRAGSVDEALALARTHVGDALADHAPALSWIAWIIVDPAGTVADKDLELALAAAERANELTHGADASVLDTLARVHFARGELERAAELQRTAVEQAEGGERKALERVLAEYERALAKKGG